MTAEHCTISWLYNTLIDVSEQHEIRRSIVFESLKLPYVQSGSYFLNGGGDGGDHEHGGQGDHDSVREVLDVEEEREEPNQHQDQGLEERVVDVVLDPPLKNDLNVRGAEHLLLVGKA